MFLSWSPSFSLPALPFFLSLSFAFLSFFLSFYLHVCVLFFRGGSSCGLRIPVIYSPVKDHLIKLTLTQTQSSPDCCVN